MRAPAAALANWNGMKYLGRCLAGLYAQTCPLSEVVVVDNGSTDGSVAWLRAHFPQVRLIENPVNLGFAVGYNQAIAACRAPFVLVLNTDVFLEPDFVALALQGFDRGTRVAAVTGRVFQQGTDELINGGFCLRRQLRIRPSPNLEEPEEVFGATGAVALFRREALEDLKVEGEYFDESYFGYGEDIDLAWRAQLWGWQVRFEPGPLAHHVGSGSLDGRLRFAEKPAFFQRHVLKNRYLTLIKNVSPRVLLSLLPAFLLAELLLWPYLFLRWPRRAPYLALALADAWRLLPLARRRRRLIQARRQVPSARIRAFLRGW
ncbi:MAG: glycosyltransferase family 2 protein [Candidatus Handelsmanbacteria bacterium]|nr:glycosyltransferase family 2 protein [Candidatus Handelsmanbacteria bacterium]